MFKKIIIIIAFICLNQSKFASLQLHSNYFRNNNKWKYITKFGMGIGEGKYKIRAKFLSSPSNKNIKDLVSVNATIHLDDRWDNVLEASTCTEKNSLSHVNLELRIPPNGEFSEYISGALL